MISVAPVDIGGIGDHIIMVCDVRRAFMIDIAAEHGHIKSPIALAAFINAIARVETAVERHAVRQIESAGDEVVPLSAALIRVVYALGDPDADAGGIPGQGQGILQGGEGVWPGEPAGRTTGVSVYIENRVMIFIYALADKTSPRVIKWG